MLARFSSSKGQDFVIEAFSKAVSICDNEEGLELVLMGAADDLASLSYVKHLVKLSRELDISRRVRFMINPSIDTVYRVLGRSTVFIHVRPYEPFGIVVAEQWLPGQYPLFINPAARGSISLGWAGMALGLVMRRRQPSVCAGPWK